jgi:hypothetical protein
MRKIRQLSTKNRLPSEREREKIKLSLWKCWLENYSIEFRECPWIGISSSFFHKIDHQLPIIMIAIITIIITWIFSTFTHSFFLSLFTFSTQANNAIVDSHTHTLAHEYTCKIVLTWKEFEFFIWWKSIACISSYKLIEIDLKQKIRWAHTHSHTLSFSMFLLFCSSINLSHKTRIEELWRTQSTK